MKAELELPPLPEGWANGPVEIGYGQSPIGSMAIYHDTWEPVVSQLICNRIYAVRKWQPAIVTAGLLEPGWIVIEECGTYYVSHFRPSWSAESREWASEYMRCLPLREMPQVTGENAIWEIK